MTINCRQQPTLAQSIRYSVTVPAGTGEYQAYTIVGMDGQYITTSEEVSSEAFGVVQQNLEALQPPGSCCAKSRETVLPVATSGDLIVRFADLASYTAAIAGTPIAINNKGEMATGGITVTQAGNFLRLREKAAGVGGAYYGVVYFQ